MRRVSIATALAVNLIMTVSQMTTAARAANEGMFDMPTRPASSRLHIKLDEPALPPMAYSMFCLHHRDECQERPLFRGGPVLLTEARWTDLKEVNQTVNSAIIPEPNEHGLTAEVWLINPPRGDCNDYAVSKRHDLLKRGWPQRTLLLGEVVTVWGKNHLVLVARTKSGDIVLDNLTQQIRPWWRAPYRWIRVQSPSTPRYWSTIVQRGV